MPAPTFQAVHTNSTRNASCTVSVTNCAVGDTLIAFQVGDYFGSTASMVAPSSATGISSWAAVGNAVKGGEMYARAWRAQITTAGTRSVTMTRPSASSSFNTVHVIRLSDVDPNQPIDATPTTGGAASGSSFAVPAIACETPDALLLGIWGGLTFSGSLTSITKPATMTQMASASVRDGSQAVVMSAREQRTVAGSTGTRTATGNTSVNTGWVGLLVAVSGVRYIPVPVTDGGTGDDPLAVDKTLVAALDEPGTGSDPVVVQNFRAPEADGGIGSDTSFVDVLTPKWATDQGTGTDKVTVALFKGNDLTDTGAASDPVTVNRLRYVPVTDQGTGSDVSTLRQDKTPTDSGLGSETVSSLRMPGLSDNGVGTDDVRVLDIPFTQVLKRTGAPPVIYDLVTMARVPQAGGPPSFMEIDPIEWKSLQYTNELSAAQTLQATCQISSVPETILQRFRSPDELPTEMWLLRNGRPVFSGPLVGLQTSGETLTINAAGVLAYLKVMFVVANYKRTKLDQHLIVKQLVDQWQSLPYGHFGIDTSSVTTAGVLRDVEYPRDELPNVNTKIDELGKAADGFDYEVDPVTRKLQLWSPRKGTDKSTGEDAIVFDGRNVTSSDIVISVAVGDLASEAYGTASTGTEDKTLYSARANLNVRTRYGRAGVAQSFSDAKEQGSLDSQTQGLLDARASALAVPGPKVRVTPDADLPDYEVGDVVSYDLGSQLGVTGAFRIRKQTVSATSTGQEAVDLEFA